MNRGLYRFTGRTGLLACALGIAGLVPGANAQLRPDAPPVPPAPAQFDPSDVYFQGYLLSKDAEKLAAEKKYSEALEKYQKAQQLFDRIHRYFPTWRKDMVEGRQGKNQAAIGQVAPEALKEQDRFRAATSEFEGGRVPEGSIIRGEEPKLLNGGQPAASDTDTLVTRHIAELEGQVRDLRSKLSDSIKAHPEANSAGRDASRLDDISRQNDLLRSQLQQAINELNRAQSQFDKPMQEDLDRLTQRIKGLEGENAANQSALAKSRKETEQAKQQIDALQKERTALMQRQADLTQALDTERKVQNEVVEGQQKQVRQLQENLRAKDAELQEAGTRIARLEGQLGEMKDSFRDLTEERDSLLRERDQMSALLKLNESGQLSELINQNMDLAKKLREASERVDMLSKDGNETKDEYAAALNDLVVAKTAINNFKREKQSQDKRIEELESRLRNEDKSLADNPAADPAETEVLRNIIQKLRRQQERRRESSEVLLQAIGEKSKKDPSIASAVELMNAAELPLSQEELKIADIADNHRIDANIDSAGVRPREAVLEETRQLNKSTAPYKQAAQRAFLNERLESARELLQMVTEANPGDIQAICSLGVINLRRKDDPAAAMAAVENFRRAVELDSQNPYAQRMLGKSLMQAGPGGEAEAEAALKRAVELAPTNLANHVVLGTLYFETGREKEAEDEFKAAIACDDSNASDAYFNLAVLYGHQGKKKKGMECYDTSLLRGGRPSPDLQKRLEEKVQ